MPRRDDDDDTVPSRIPLRQMSPVMSLHEARVVLRVRRAVLLDLVRDGSLRIFQRGKNHYCTDEALRAAIRKLEERYAVTPPEAA